MSNHIFSESFWVLFLIHLVMAVEFFYFKLCKPLGPIRISTFSPRGNGSQTNVYSFSTNQYRKFPRNSYYTFVKTVKVLII